MKKGPIIAIVVIAVAIFMIISTMSDASTYVDFNKAQSLFESGNTTKIHVVGTLKKDTNNEIVGMYYNAVENPNFFKFIMVDNNGREEEVVFNDPKPANFEMSEQVVVIGNFIKGGTFLADQILTKCPSKYQEDTIEVGKVKP